MSDEFSHLKELIQGEEAIVKKKRAVLQDLDMFVLDNSLRESTVGQLRGHTLADKENILHEVKKCKFEHIIVSAFNHTSRVDDAFVQKLTGEESDFSKYYAFSEIGEGEKKRELPISLEKMKQHGLQNPIFEIDLAQSAGPNFLEEMCELLEKRIKYAHDELCRDAKVFVNLRDFPFAMKEHPDLVFKVVQFLGKMDTELRPFGLMFEEPTGRFLPETMGGWTMAIRRLMDDCGWNLLPEHQGGHLLAHIHKKWEFAEVVQLECLSTGANGVWASICEEGAALGHACSIVSIMNLIRFGNKKVLDIYNCTYLREAAINVTKFTTGNPPHSKQAIYGERALDLAFGFGKIAGGVCGKNDFDLAKFFGIDPPVRISTLADVEMVKKRLVTLFGEHEIFTTEAAKKMKEVMQENLTNNHKEEYMSYVGLAMLFDKAGGKMTDKMRAAIEDVELNSKVHRQLLREVRKMWDNYDVDVRERAKDDDCLQYHSFYSAFMAPHFGCYECEESKKGLKAIDMDKDGKVDWGEFCVYLKWALHEYPKIATTKDLLTTAFTRGLIPAMQDELVKLSS